MSPSRPPPDRAWQPGKTAATIRFVDDAEAALASRSLSDHEKIRLSTVVQLMKDGRMSLDDWQTVDEWLEQLHLHAP